MTRLSALCLLSLFAVAPAASAQAPVPAPPPASRNVRFDLTITEATTPKPTVKTVVLILTEPNTSGAIRNNARIPAEPGTRGTTVTDKDGKTTTNPPAPTNVGLNIDVRNVTFLPGDMVRASIGLEYYPYAPNERIQPASIIGNAAMTFESGKKATILQTVDPVTDRKTTVDVTATILK